MKAESRSGSSSSRELPSRGIRDMEARKSAMDWDLMSAMVGGRVGVVVVEALSGVESGEVVRGRLGFL